MLDCGVDDICVHEAKAADFKLETMKSRRSGHICHQGSLTIG